MSQPGGTVLLSSASCLIVLVLAIVICGVDVVPCSREYLRAMGMQIAVDRPVPQPPGYNIHQKHSRTCSEMVFSLWLQSRYLMAGNLLPPLVRNSRKSLRSGVLTPGELEGRVSPPQMFGSK